MDIAHSHTERRSLPHAALAGAVLMIRRWWQWRIERWELLSMDDRELRDIGLTRTDARRLAARPIWWR